MSVYSTRAHMRSSLCLISLHVRGLWPWRYCKWVSFVPVKYLVDLVENQGEYPLVHFRYPAFLPPLYLGISGTRYEQGGYGKPGILPARLVRATQMPCVEYLGVPIYE
ncbi:hypothetical protein CDEST_12186 [Colletotrichum destructivum]|uniref:Uncharacterized protein n=1 Tax=Colletotrichum destructivum TaxID=34406 RepID=A0AAX4IVC9_9PEZI|nr:hypothetical protein CDEST_12186 [Colletotrichum destructivum]